MLSLLGDWRIGDGKFAHDAAYITSMGQGVDKFHHKSASLCGVDDGIGSTITMW